MYIVSVGNMGITVMCTCVCHAKTGRHGNEAIGVKVE